MNTLFGHEKITPQEKTERIEKLFSNVSSKYDFMNDLMSGGLHRVWKKHFVLSLPVKSNDILLDMAGGTGDITFLIQNTYRALNIKSIICDLTVDMLYQGQQRDQALNSNITWCSANAESLPFSDCSVDGYIISFGLRNVADRQKAFSEAYRVLKPKGWFYCLEFSPRMKKFWLDRFYKIYSQAVIPLLGQYMANDRYAYQYLIDSIQTFPKAHELQKEMECASFSVTYESLTNGLVYIHKGNKI